MNTDILNNKYALLNLKLKYSGLIIISLILFLLLIFSSIYYKTYDSFKVSGIIHNTKIVITVFPNDINDIVKSDFFKVNKEKYKFSVESISEVEYDVNSNSFYQKVTLSTSGNFLDNEIVDLTFYKNKQRIINKVINLLK
ncbi:MAG: hypothetical protein IJN03_00435 [Bacilli bacterium]|nr:hypothetical protein [Bacilli bacterium]